MRNLPHRASNGRGKLPLEAVAPLFPAPAAGLESLDLPVSPPTWSSLHPAPTVISQMADIRGHIAGNSKGITRDDTIVRELVKLLHAKTHDEQELRSGRMGRFYFLRGEVARDGEGTGRSAPARLT